MKILVCGGRDWHDRDATDAALNMLDGVEIVIHGNANGADELGAVWAVNNKIHAVSVPAQWDAFGRSAGPKRNAAMMLLQPNLVVAFPGGAGTRNMVELAERAGVTVWQPYT